MKKEISEKRKELDALFNRPGEKRRELTREEAILLERQRERAERLLKNKDFVEFMTELELDYGGYNYTTEEIDLFTQGRISFFNEMKSRLYCARTAPEVFAKMIAKFIQPMTDEYQELLENKETKDE